MEIIAVIPARANSKRIPNKCIRLLHDRPMIYYSIQNALQSRYITRVVVTTDSKEIMTIAHQLGVECVERSPELCRDDITLDAVICHAVQNMDCDYVVTLQPTSPLLTVESLDGAIVHCIEENLDTVISVINRPRLAWEKINGQIQPKYEERLNSQYLPPYYQETGAFFINKRSIMTDRTRIGERVDIFEISEEEAVDINSFQTLAMANAILRKKRVAFYVNGNNKRGMGHIYRSLELADEFYSRPDIYFDQNQTALSVFGQTSHKLIPVDGLNDLLERIKAENYDIFISDILATSIDYMIALRKCIPNAKLINFEDEGEGSYEADLVFNALYQKYDMPNMKYGEKYYIAPKLFMSYQPIEVKEEVENVFISFGGADPQNYTDRVLKIITSKPEKYREFHFCVILGRSKLNIEALLKYNEMENIEVLYDIKNMPEVMSGCDIALTSRGRTCYELAMIGIPTIAMAQNQREEAHGFACHENGFNYLGLNPRDSVIETNLDMYLHFSKDARAEQQKMLLSKDLRHGRQRVMNLIHSL